MSDINIFACDDSACIFQVNDAALDPRPFYVLSADYSALKEDFYDALGREAALREELETEKRANYNAKVALKAASETCELWKGRTTNLTHTNSALQQRLTVAEQRAGELENELRDALEWIESGDRIPYNMVRSIKAALKPAEEGEGS